MVDEENCVSSLSERWGVVGQLFLGPLLRDKGGFGWDVRKHGFSGKVDE